MKTLLLLFCLIPQDFAFVEQTTSVFVLHVYEGRIRLNGKVSTTQVQASDAGQAKKLIQAQFPNAVVLSVKRK